MARTTCRHGVTVCRDEVTAEEHGVTDGVGALAAQGLSADNGLVLADDESRWSDGVTA